MWRKPGAADAHDAGRLWPCRENKGQLTLVMLAGFGHIGTNQGQLMLIMLAWLGHVGKTIGS